MHEDIPCAIYLFGHGAQREPYLLEIQHRVIIRALRWLGQHWDGHVQPGEVFVDMNFPPSDDPRTMHGLARLIQAIRAGTYKYVAMRIAWGTFPSQQHDWIERVLESEGAKVCNLAGEIGPFLPEEGEPPELLERLASAMLPTDAEEAVALFPAFAANIAREAFRFYDRPGVLSISQMHLLDTIAKDKAYGRSHFPQPVCRDFKRIREEFEAQQRAAQPAPEPAPTQVEQARPRARRRGQPER
ncbi:MAG: hypothetical protein MUF54_04560 [Polyangiaceae bacterium]|jgi:hypothetical protein|nr:hypothetical protein [Polyangiaceae bacterium]